MLNFAGGIRNARQIRDAVSAEYGPVPLGMAVEYLKALEAAGVIERTKKDEVETEERFLSPQTLFGMTGFGLWVI